MIIVSIPGQPAWLDACLPTVFAAAGDLAIDVVVVDNGSPEAAALVESRFPDARVVHCPNHGFAHGNNRALMSVDARYVLFLNPDTEIVRGTLPEMVALLDARPHVGMAGCRQVGPEGEIQETMRRFPTPLRLLMEGLFVSESWPRHLSWTGQRILDRELYAGEFDADWTSGSFMLCPREALESAGWFDERFFIYCEETDLALRMRQAGWTVRHMPQMEIIHHVGKMGWSERGFAQNAFAYRQYVDKHFTGVRRIAAIAALLAGWAFRALLYPIARSGEPDAAIAMRAAMRGVLARGAPPYEAPPPVAVRRR